MGQAPAMIRLGAEPQPPAEHLLKPHNGRRSGLADLVDQPASGLTT